MAITHPERVSKLVIWGGNAFITSEDLELCEETRSLSSWSRRMRKSLEGVYGDTLQDHWSAWCVSMQAIYQAGGEIYRERLHLVRCPRLILHGGHDPLVPGFHPEVLHQGIARSRLRTFPEGRHNLHLAHAGEFNRLVREFLEE